MLTIIQVHKKLGLWKDSDLLNPSFQKKIHGVEVPSGSLLVTSRPIDVNIKKHVYIETIAPKTTCNSVVARVSRLDLITQRKKLDTDSIYLSRKELLNKVSNTNLAVYDTSELPSLVTYHGATAEHCSLGASLVALLKPAKEEQNKHLIISIPVPSKIPTLQELKKLFKFRGKKLTNALSKDFFPFLELLKTLNQYSDPKSVNLFDLSFDQATRVTLLLESETAYVYLRLDYLYSLFGIVPENYKSVIAKRNERTANLIILNLITKLKLQDYVEELSEDDQTKIKELSGELTEESLNDIIDIVSSNSVIQEAPLESLPTVDLVKDETMLDQAHESIHQAVLKGSISKNKAQTMLDKIDENQKNLPVITTKDTEIVPIKAPDLNGVIDKSQLLDTLTSYDDTYLKNVYGKQTKQVIHHMERAGYVVKKYEVTRVKDYSNHTDIHKITITPPNGNTSTLTLRVPVIEPDGTIKFNGKQYTLQKQTLDVPIKHIDAYNVLMTSYYSKFFIKKADAVKNNIAEIIYKELDNSEHVKVLVEGSAQYEDIKLPLMYKVLGRKIAMITFNTSEGKHLHNKYGFKLSFSYRTRDSLIHGTKKLSDIEKNGTLVGVVTKDGKVLEYITIKDSKSVYDATVLIGKTTISLIKLLNIRPPEPEHAITRLGGKKFPLIIPFLGWYGLDATISMLKCKVSRHPAKERLTLTADQYLIKFQDLQYVFDKNETTASMLLSGLNTYVKYNKQITAKALNTESGVLDYMLLVGLNERILREFDLAKKLWVDPMTRLDLIAMNEPTTVPALFIRACEMLASESYIDQNNVTLNRIKGNERMNAFLLTTITNSLRNYHNKVGKVRASISESPYAIYNLLASESTFRLIEDLSPVSERAIKHTITMTGMYGRTSEAITTKHRTFHPSQVGYISENTKNTADVGIVAQLSATPFLSNTLGLNKNIPNKDITASSVISEAGQMQPESLKQDTKRLLFQSIQSPAVVPTIGDHPNVVRSGFEAVYPYRVGDKYAIHAKQKGKVLKVTDKSITIKYKDSSETYDLKEWFSRDEGGVTYKHHHETMLKEGMTLLVGDNILYDATVMSPDVLEKNRVAYNNGQTCIILLDNGSKSYEDSDVMTEEFAENMACPITYVIDDIVQMSDTILHKSEIGDHVNFEDSLFTTIASDALSGTTNPETIELLKELNGNSLMAGHNGTIKAIEIIYNSDLTNVSDSLLKLIKQTDKYMKKIHGTTGKVDHTYSNRGRGLEDNEMHIKYYLEHNITMGNGSKGMNANQLKFTVGEIIPYLKVISNGKEFNVAQLFNDASVSARIVVSPVTIGRVSMILQAGTNELMELTYGKDWHVELTGKHKPPFYSL